MKRVFLFVLAGLTLGSAYAQDNKTGSYSVSGGLLAAANFNKLKIRNENPDNIKYEMKTGWSAGGYLNFPVGTGFSIEPQLMYSRIPYLMTTTTTSPVLIRDGKLAFLSLPVLFKFHAGENFAITAGPQMDFLMSVKNNTSSIAVKEDFNKSAFSIFGGLEVFPRGKVTIFGRYIHGLSNLAADNDHSNLNYQNNNIQAGLKFRLFGGTRKAAVQATDVAIVIPDRDGDGINDQLDKCPDVAGVAKYDGCPIPDTDGDGINDEMDKCPNEKGIAKYDGCPIPDSDGDGINDELDKCPNEKGTAEREGCPVSDRDNDGVADDVDKCPDLAGTTANSGCPDVPANVSKSLGMMGSSVTFGTNNAKLTTKSNTTLNNVVTLMNENPGLRIRIEGHTDNTGDAAAKEQLSLERAEAVKAYLVSKGISADRIKAEGFGGTQPNADNKTAAGRAKNNRIEFRVDY